MFRQQRHPTAREMYGGREDLDSYDRYGPRPSYDQPPPMMGPSIMDDPRFYGEPPMMTDSRFYGQPPPMMMGAGPMPGRRILPGNVELEQGLLRAEERLEHAKMNPMLTPVSLRFLDDTEAVLEDLLEIVHYRNGDEKLQRFVEHTFGLGQDLYHQDPDIQYARAKAQGPEAQFAKEQAKMRRKLMLEEAGEHERMRRLWGAPYEIERIEAEKRKAEMRAMEARMMRTEQLYPQDAFKASRQFAMRLVRDAEFRSTLRDVLQLLKDIAGQSNVVGRAKEAITHRGAGSRTSVEFMGAEVPLVEAEPGLTPYNPISEEEWSARRARSGTLWTSSGELIVEAPLSRSSEELLDTRSQQQQQQQQQQLTTQEQKDELYRRGQAILQKIAQQPEWHKAINALFGLIKKLQQQKEEYGPRARQAFHMRADMLRNDPHTHAVKREGQAILEEFTGGKSLDPLIENLRLLLLDIRRNPILSAALRDTRNNISIVMEHPEALDDPEFKRRMRLNWDTFVSEMMHYLRDDPHYIQTIRETQDLLDRITHDPLLQKLTADTARLMEDLVRDPVTGRVRISPQLFNDVRTVLMPLILEHIKYIPLPAYSDVVHTKFGTYEIAVRNVVLPVYDILPDNFHAKVYSDLDLNLKGVNPSTTASSIVRFKLRNIQAHFHNVDVYINRLDGHLTTNPLVDIDTTGKGIKLIIEVKMSPTQPIFVTQRIRCRVHGLRIKARGTKLGPLVNIGSSLFGGRICRMIESKVEQSLEQILGLINDKLNFAAAMATEKAPQAARNLTHRVTETARSKLHPHQQEHPATTRIYTVPEDVLLRRRRIEERFVPSSEYYYYYYHDQQPYSRDRFYDYEMERPIGYGYRDERPQVEFIRPIMARPHEPQYDRPYFVRPTVMEEGQYFSYEVPTFERPVERPRTMPARSQPVYVEATVESASLPRAQQFRESTGTSSSSSSSSIPIIKHEENRRDNEEQVKAPATVLREYHEGPTTKGQTQIQIQKQEQIVERVVPVSSLSEQERFITPDSRFTTTTIYKGDADECNKTTTTTQQQSSLSSASSSGGPRFIEERREPKSLPTHV